MLELSFWGMKCNSDVYPDFNMTTNQPGNGISFYFADLGNWMNLRPSIVGIKNIGATHLYMFSN
jgi:hypothetical protein